MLSSCTVMEADSPWISFSTSRRISSAVLVIWLRVSANCHSMSDKIGDWYWYSLSCSPWPGAPASLVIRPSKVSVLWASTVYTPPMVIPSPSSAAGSRMASVAIAGVYV